MLTFIQGLTMGLAYVAPIGTQNMFVINSALQLKRRRALLTALIVIFFDVSLAFACFFGVGAVLDKLSWLKMIILGIGSLVVLYIGLSLIFSKTQELEKSAVSSSVWKTITTACVVTWFNPQAIIDGTVMLGAFRATLSGVNAAAFITGVACASVTWFTSVTLLISLFSNRINAKVLRVLNIVCGCIIVFYGGKLMYGFITQII